ncbi:aldehyde dehydrogenase [Roridomyces roridus]|uniref:Aldehyde dehydrogenase n=1 Tax=Roridomyces roridus TaxID=1738132 RepID=A0AAD7BRY9_9AGAR|nr:aldehyde dehydrogenase [Roridomyces roridus]
MPAQCTLNIDKASYKGSIPIHTGHFIDGKWCDPKFATILLGSSADVDMAVQAAQKAYKTSWGLKILGSERGRLLNRLADLLERDKDHFSAIESLNIGKPFHFCRTFEIPKAIECLRYFGGWADKNQGKLVPTDETKLAYTRHEPYGVVGQIIPWNFPIPMLAWKIAPALATGNCVVLKPSEIAPLSTMKFAELIEEAGFPPGVVNIVNGYGNVSFDCTGIYYILPSLGHTVGQAITEHPGIAKVAFTGSTAVGRKILEAAAKSNLKSVTLELGGKSPIIVFDDCDLEQTVKWAVNGIFINAGQVCVAGSRIFVQDTIYEAFMREFTPIAAGLAGTAGDPFQPITQHGPQVSQTHFDRVMSYIESGKSEGATVHLGGARHGTEGYFIQPTIFTDCMPDMKIVKEEIFGPVVAIMKFGTETEVIEAANATTYGLACCVFSGDVSRAIRVAHQLENGSAFVNSAMVTEPGAPFGGFKQSGIGREQGEYALATYTQVKAVHVNLSMRI